MIQNYEKHFEVVKGINDALEALGSDRVVNDEILADTGKFNNNIDFLKEHKQAISDFHDKDITGNAVDVRGFLVRDAELKTRKDILDFLENREGLTRNGRLSWDIKLHNLDVRSEQFKENSGCIFDSIYDEAWDQLLEKNDFAGIIAENLLEPYVRNDVFIQVGRSGGHLSLAKLPQKDGYAEMPLFSDHEGYVQTLREMSDDDLAQLYVLVEQVDKEVKNRHSMFQAEFAKIRWDAEWKWNENLSFCGIPSPLAELRREELSEHYDHNKQVLVELLNDDFKGISEESAVEFISQALSLFEQEGIDPDVILNQVRTDRDENPLPKVG